MNNTCRKILPIWLILIIPLLTLHAQVKINEKFDHVLLEDVLKKINQKYGIKFAFDDQLVQNVYITVNIKSEPLPKALEKILSETNLEAIPVNEVWILRKRTFQKDKRIGRNRMALVNDKLSGESVPYARISIDNKPITTDNRGIFVLPPLLKDTVTIRVTSPGYNTQTLIVARTDLQNQYVIVELSPETFFDSITLSTIYEVGDKMGEIIVNARNVNWLPQLHTLDALAPLLLVPGIDATFENTDRLIVRHQGSDKNLITLDGFNIYQTEHFFGAISAFNINAVKDIRIRRGGLDISQGGRTSSMIELTGKTGNNKRTSASAGADMLLAHATLEGPVGKDFTYFISARHSLTNYYLSPLYFQLLKNILSEDISFRQKLTVFATDTAPSSLQFYDINAKISFHPSKFDLITLSGYLSNDLLDFKLNGVNKHITENATWGNKGIGWQWSRQWNEVVSHRFSIGYSSYNLEYFHHDTTLRRRFRQRDTILKNYDIENQLRDINLNFSSTLKISEHHTIESGFNYNKIDINTNESYLQTNNQLNIIDTSRIYQFNPAISSAWIQYTASYGILRALSFAFRAEYPSIVGKVYLNPRFEGYLNLSPSLTLKASAGTYRQYVSKILQVGSSYRNLWIAADGKNFPVIRSDKASAGITWRNNQNYYFDLEAYLQKTSGIVYMQRNIRRTSNQLKASYKIYQLVNHSSGIDIMAGKKWNFLETWVSYNFSQSTNQSDLLNNGKPYPSIDDHLHELKIGTVYWWRKWSLAATWIYGSARPWDEIKFTSSLQLSPDYNKNASRLPSYHRLDASLGYSIHIKKSKLDCGIKVFNLYNQTNILSRIFTLTETPLLDYIQGKPFYTYQENQGMSLAFNLYVNWSF
ncbi:MAG: hypothetical protein N2662_02520 [Bacteroidales bacterium]|nr:hypothetical protein [Bacteroidales bacterium]